MKMHQNGQKKKKINPHRKFWIRHFEGSSGAIGGPTVRQSFDRPGVTYVTFPW